jgi:hypothetical protein
MFGFFLRTIPQLQSIFIRKDTPTLISFEPVYCMQRVCRKTSFSWKKMAFLLKIRHFFIAKMAFSTDSTYAAIARSAA